MMKEYIEEAEKALLHTYNRFQIVLDKGEGVHLYDIEGREYLDFVSGIAVFALGYNYKDYNDALKVCEKIGIHIPSKQISKYTIWHKHRPAPWPECP